MRHSKTFQNSLRSLAVAGIFMAAAASMGQSVLLRLNLPVGKSMKYTMTNKMTSTSPGGGGSPMNLDMTQKIDTTMKVLSKTAKGHKIQTVVDKATVSAPKGSAMASQASQMGSSMKGASYSAIYDAQARMVAGSLESTGAMGRAMTQMGAMNAGFLGVEFPAKQVAPGATWSSSIDFAKLMAGMGPAANMKANGKIPIKYKFAKLENRGGKQIAHVNYTMIGNVDMAMGGNNAQANGMKIKVGINMAGKLQIDVASGAPLAGASGGTTSINFGTMNMGQKMAVSFKQV